MTVQGSFRGIPFFTAESTTTAGHRRAVYELPYTRGGVVSIDQGRRARRYQLTVFFLGDDYEGQVTTFLSALEKPGPGLLVHPYLGRVMVIPSENVSVHTSTGKLGKAEISFEALESVAPVSAQPGASELAAKKSALRRSAGAMKVASAKQFEASWDLTGVSEFVRSANLASVTNVLANLRKATGTIDALLSIPGTIASEIDAISLQVADLINTPDQLIASLQAACAVTYQALARVAGEIAEDVLVTGDQIAASETALLANRAAVIYAAIHSDLTEGDDPISTRDTAMRRIQRANASALQQAMFASAIAEIAIAANTTDWPSTADNTLIRDALKTSIEALLMLELSPDLVDSTEATRANIWARFTRVGTALTSYEPPTELPASVIAYELYGDATRSDEIVARNAVAHPSAVPGGVALTVLVR